MYTLRDPCTSPFRDLYICRVGYKPVQVRTQQPLHRDSDEHYNNTKYMYVVVSSTPKSNVKRFSSAIASKMFLFL